MADISYRVCGFEGCSSWIDFSNGCSFLWNVSNVLSPFYQQLKHCGSQKLTCRDNQWIRLALRSGIQGGCLLDISTLLRNSWRLKQLIIYADVVCLSAYPVYLPNT